MGTLRFAHPTKARLIGQFVIPSEATDLHLAADTTPESADPSLTLR
jgi:hypothetical protein